MVDKDIEHCGSVGVRCYSCGTDYPYVVRCTDYAKLPKCCLATFKNSDHIHIRDDKAEEIGILCYGEDRYKGKIILVFDEYSDISPQCLCEAKLLLQSIKEFKKW